MEALQKYPEANRVSEELLQNMKSTLGDKLVGVYLYGSLATGDFNPKISDIDILAAISSDLTDEEFDKLKSMHESFVKTNPAWNERIEAQYLTTQALKNFKTTMNNAAVVSPGEPFHMREVGDHWLMNWYMVRERGLTLFGPDPKEIIEPVSKEEFIDSVKNHTKSWNEWIKGMKNRKAQAYSILTLCRALYAAEKGDQPSKKQAAIWAEKEMPEWAALINNAVEWREAESDVKDDEDNYAKTVEFVNAVRNKILGFSDSNS